MFLGLKEGTASFCYCSPSSFPGSFPYPAPPKDPGDEDDCSRGYTQVRRVRVGGAQQKVLEVSALNPVIYP